MDTVGPSPVCGEPLIGAAAAETIPPTMPGGPGSAPQLQLLDYFFPGFSVLSAAVNKYLHIDLNLYIPLVLLCGGLTFVWRYFTEYLWGLISDHLMSVVDVRPDDECYNFLMSWVANQRFAKTARRFVVNTNLNSVCWTPRSHTAGAFFLRMTWLTP
jgi:chaperone BCS1